MPAEKIAEYWVVLFGEDASEDFSSLKLARQWIKDGLSEGVRYYIQKVVVYDVEGGVKQ